MNILSYVIFFSLIGLAVFARYKNTCNCQEDEEKWMDITQIIVMGLGLSFFIGINNSLKATLVVLVSRIVVVFLFSFFKKKKEKKEDCEDCNPYNRVDE